MSANLLKISEVSKLLGLAPQTIRTRLYKRNVPYEQPTPKLILVRQEHVHLLNGDCHDEVGE